MKKFFLLICLFCSLSAWASVPVENIECFYDMSDGMCTLSETRQTYNVKCIIDVTLVLKSGDTVYAEYVGTSSVKKNRFAVFMNDVVKDKALTLAQSEMYEKIIPFFSMKYCE